MGQDEETTHATAWTPRASRLVDFYGDELLIALVDDAAYIALRPVCDYLGLDWSAQRRRLYRDEVLTEQVRPIMMTGADGRQRDMVCPRLEYLPGWLFGVTPSKARPELAPKIKRYRAECFQVLWQTFQAEIPRRTGGAVTASSGTMALVQVRELALAIAEMAEQQLALQEQVTAVNVRMDRAAAVVGDLRQRLSRVERRLDPAGTIGDDQAAEVAARVKALAELLTGRDATKNHYQGIFGELYRRFGVSSYKLIRMNRYEEVLRFLEDWRQATTNSGQATS